MDRTDRSCLAAAACCAALLVVPLRAQDPVREPPAEEWLVLSIAGVPAGYTHRTREAIDVDGRPAVRFTERGLLRMKRLGADIEMSGRTVAVERLDGTPVRMESVQDLSARETRTVVEFADGEARIAVTTAGRTQESQRPVPANLLGLHGLERAILARLSEPGAEIEAQVWIPDFGGVTEVYASVFGPEEVELESGETRSLVRVDVDIESAAVKATTWYDSEGREMRTRLQMIGVEFGTRQATAEEVRELLRKSDGPSADVFAGSLVTEPVFVPAPRSAVRAVVRVRERERERTVEVLEDDRQRLLATDADRSRLFEIRAVVPPPGCGGVRPVVELPEEVRPCIRPAGVVQSDAPAILAIAREVTGDERDAWRAAQALERWVERNVTDKNLDVGFASALEVVEDRAGDCSEHAVLLCALCRAAGIPSRVAMGLLYVGGIWGGHAWNEVWIDGRWYALDATIGAGRADALHLALGKMTLADGDAAAEFRSLLGSLGRLDVEVVELTRGVTIRPSDAAGTIEDGRYVDRAFGVSLRIPDGLSAEVRRPEQGIGFELLRARGKVADGTRLRVALRAHDVDPGGGWPRHLPVAGGEDIEVDGRPAVRVYDGDDEDRLVRVLVRAAGVVYELRAEPLVPATAEIVEALLESMDFDV